MKEFTVERNPMDVRNVGKPSSNVLTYKCIEELTLK
jgi:hypothetical protein